MRYLILTPFLVALAFHPAARSQSQTQINKYDRLDEAFQVFSETCMQTLPSRQLVIEELNSKARTYTKLGTNETQKVLSNSDAQAWGFSRRGSSYIIALAEDRCLLVARTYASTSTSEENFLGMIDILLPKIQYAKFDSDEKSSAKEENFAYVLGLDDRPMIFVKATRNPSSPFQFKAVLAYKPNVNLTFKAKQD